MISPFLDASLLSNFCMFTNADFLNLSVLALFTQYTSFSLLSIKCIQTSDKILILEH